MDGNSETPKADDDIFEICDFTVVTDFEHLILSLETSLIEWKLNGSSISCPSDDYFKRLPKDFLRTCTWKVDMQIMKHLDRRFKMLYYKSTPEDEEANDVGESEEASHHTKSALGLSSPLTDFVPSIISTQFGVFDFIVISDADSDFPLPEDEVLMFISAVNIATVNIDCELPIFIQIGPANNFLFSGVSQNRHVRTSFEGAYLRRPLYNHDNLSGLMGVLREKVGTPVSFPPRMTASIQFDYCFKEKLEGNFLSDFPNALIDVKSLICSQNSMFPFGTTADPLSEFRLIVRWPNQIENVVNENQTFTDLEPDYAPFWFASVDLVSSVPCLLYEGLKTVVSHISSEAGSVQTLHFTKSAESESSQTGANALSKVTNEHYSTYNFVPSTPLMKSESDEKELVSKWIEMIFSTEDHETSVAHIDKLHSRSCDVTRSQSPGTAVKQTHNEGPPFDYRHDNSEKSFDPDITKLLCTSKSAPVGSLTERICQCLARALMMEDNGLFLFSHLWMAIVGKLRSLWDNSYNLPGFSEGQAPDLSASLFHQKLQMLQCCIEAKRRSYEMYDDTTDFNSSDVFFDALEDVNEGNVTVPTSGKAEPVGRHCIAEGLFYLTDPNKQLFVPITQDRSPMTEDMLEEHAEYLSSLTDADARANAQIGSLMSDMQAFKAANPDCCMADFVRWHSPRDWIEESGGEGKLSERMSTEGNTWQTTWNAAHSVPVSLQQRLFNYSGDAEKILQRLEHSTISELISMILPIVFTSSVRRLVDEASPYTNLICMEEKLKKVAKLLRHSTMSSASLDSYLDLLREMKTVELYISYVVAVTSRFSDLIKQDDSLKESVKEFAIALVDRFLEKDSHEAHPLYDETSRRMVPVLGAPSSPLALTICKLMSTDERVTSNADASSPKGSRYDAKYPPPDRKQYIIRWCAPRPGLNSRPVFHRMYVSIASEEFRLCSSVTDDIVLM